MHFAICACRWWRRFGLHLCESPASPSWATCCSAFSTPLSRSTRYGRQSHDFELVYLKIDEAKGLSVCLCACPSQAIPRKLLFMSSSSIFGTVAATDMRMHHVLILLTLTFIQGHMYPNKNNKCSVILETVQAMPITFAVRIVWGKVYISFSQSDDLALHSRSQLCLKLYKCLTCTRIAISKAVLKLWHSNLAWRYMHGI